MESLLFYKHLNDATRMIRFAFTLDRGAINKTVIMQRYGFSTEASQSSF